MHCRDAVSTLQPDRLTRAAIASLVIQYRTTLQKLHPDKKTPHYTGLHFVEEIQKNALTLMNQIISIAFQSA